MTFAFGNQNMSDSLIIHWGADRISALQAAKSDTFQTAQWELPEAAFESDEQAGAWLKGQLASHRFTSRRAEILLPRADVVLRKLTLPDVPENELPDLVRMQAATKSSIPLDRLRIDFIPLPLLGEQRPILLTTATAQHVDSILARVRAANLEPIALGATPFATAARLCGPDETTFLIALDHHHAELTLCKQGTVEFSHATEITLDDPDEDERWFLAEVTRSLVAADHRAVDGGLTRFLLVGDSPLLPKLARSLQDRYECPAEIIDSTDKLEARISSPVGLLPLAAMLGQLASTTAPRVDFLNPRRRIEQPDRTRLKQGILAGAVAATILAAYLNTWWTRRGIDQQTDALGVTRSEIETLLTNGKPILDKRTDIQGWVDRQATWPEEFVLLENALPGTDRMYLTEVNLQPGGRDVRGAMTINGRARSPEDVSGFASTSEALGYRVEPPQNTRDAADSEYPNSFEFVLTVPRPETK